MATIQEIVQERLNRLDTVPDWFATRGQIAQRQMMEYLLVQLNSLDTTGGRLLLTEENLRRVDAIINGLLDEGMMQGEYRTAVKDFLEQFAVQGTLQDRYFERILERFNRKPIYDAVIKSAQRRTLAAYTGQGLYSPVLQPIREQLAASVTTGDSMTSAIQRLRGVVLGDPQAEGRLLRYIKTTAYDVFAINDRNYGLTVTEDLGFEFYRYQGGLVKDSRDFCRERDEGFYHKEEIRAWGELKNWDGRRDGTDEHTIFSFLGGWNCKHSLVGISEFAVPEEVIERAVANGWYKAKS